MKKKRAKLPAPKPYLHCNGVFTRKNGKPVSWKNVDALLAAIEKAGFLYGGGLELLTEEEATAEPDHAPPTVTACGSRGNPVEVAVRQWTIRKG